MSHANRQMLGVPNLYNGSCEILQQENIYNWEDFILISF